MYRKLSSVHLTKFGGKFFGLCLFQLGNASHRFWMDLIISVIVISPDVFHQFGQNNFVFWVNLCEGHNGAHLPVDQLPQPHLPLDDAVGAPILQHWADRKTTNSMGSTLCVITTSWAYLFSTKIVTILTPTWRTGVLLVGMSPLPTAFFWAWTNSLCFFCFVSG